MGNANFQPSFKFCMQLGSQGGCTKMPFLKVAALLLKNHNKVRNKRFNEIIISTFQTTHYPHANHNSSLERSSPWLICNLDCFMSFRKKNSDFITIILHTFLPDIFTNLKKDEYNAISQWFTREEVKGLFDFPLRWPAHQEETGDRSVQ